MVKLPKSWWTLPVPLGTGNSTHTETSILSPTPTRSQLFSSLSKNFHRKCFKANKTHMLFQLWSFASFLCWEPKAFGYLVFFLLFLLALISTWSARMKFCWGRGGVNLLLNFKLLFLSFLTLLPFPSSLYFTLHFPLWKKHIWNSMKIPSLCGFKSKTKTNWKRWWNTLFGRKAGEILFLLLQILAWL